ncbi:RHS element core protein [Kluyvera sp. NPDC087067]|uniref:RHS element core protein n=1 Tax=Kluyvera sp. NPDC087067 TaxID=3364105 RepID=UPI0038132B9A
MSGKPAARQGDMTKYGGPIVQGSLGVMIGAPSGVACSVCPGGVTSGNPVNPLLGAKVQPGESDIALPGPLPFILTRSYNSYQTKTPAPVGLFGPGWKMPADMRLQLRDAELILNDNGGRSIHFEPLFPGECSYSRSESFWLARGGVAALHDSHPLHALWQTLPEAIRLSPNIYLATNSFQGPWWILGWAERVPGVDEVLPAPLPPYRVLTGLADRFGRTLRYHRAAEGELTGHITGVTDGNGRRFQLVLTTQAQRAEAAEEPYPEGLPAAGYGQDCGVRLSQVWLTHDPLFPDKLTAPLVRYAYSPHGELLAVYDHSDTQVRHFSYDPQHTGRMVAQQHAGRPPVSYGYDTNGRVIAQHHPDGLSYTYAYGKNTVTITDSLNRREVLHTEGEGGLKRVVKKEFADGSVTHSEFDGYGRLKAQTDAAGRRTEYTRTVTTGIVTEVMWPDGRKTRYGYNRLDQLTATTYPDGLHSSRDYDEMGRLVKETSRSGEVTTYSYDDVSSELPSSVQDATGSRKKMRWRDDGLLLAFTDCSGYQTRYEYDRFGQMTAMHREEGLSVYQTYNRRGFLVSRKDNDGHETRYDYNAAGDLTTVTGPDGNRTETHYDSRGNIISTTQGGLTRKMAYDAASRLTTLINENAATTTFSYDVMDRLTEQTGFDGRCQRYEYDLTGTLTQSRDENLITGWHYDEAGRLTHRTVNGEPAEQWQYDERGWLTDISHLSEGHRVAVHYGYDTKGRLTGERQTVHNPQTDELLWQHQTKQGYSTAGLANRFKPDNLPPVEWLTYGSGYLAGMKLGDTPLIELTRDRLHRETQRRFGGYEQTSAYTTGGQLQYHHLNHDLLNRDYGYNDAGQLIQIHSPLQTRHYRYSDSGRLTSVRTTAANLDITLPYATDPAGNRLPDPELYPDSPFTEWKNNRITEDAHYLYRYDLHGRITEKTDRIPDYAARMDDERTHRYDYDNQHRLTHYTRTQYNTVQAEARYLYDPLGRRIGKQVWKLERDHPDHDQMAFSRKPYVTWYGWEGDRLVTEQTQQTRIQTLYTPGSFTPLLRIETDVAELARAHHRSLAEKLQQEGRENGQPVMMPPVLVQMLDKLEAELRCNAVSEENRRWLAGCGLTVDRMAAQLDPVYEPPRAIHLYHCDHRGLPLALIDREGSIVWQAEYNEWGYQLSENNPHNITQSLRLPGQQYDEESGLHYNRHRYYEPLTGRYITQDPIGLEGGWNLYQYSLNPVQGIDPLGLAACKVLYPDYPIEYMNGRTSTWLGGHGGIVGYDENGSTKYYEYGRYNPSLKGIVGVKLPTDDGNIRNVSMPDLVLDKDGNPTNESLEKLKAALSTKAGKNTNAELICSKDVDEKKVYEYINKVANDEKRDKYNWNPLSPNQCRSFADDAFDAGG